MEQPPWPLQAIALENVGEGAVADVLAQNLRAALQEAHSLIRRVKLDLHPCAIHRGVSGLASASPSRICHSGVITRGSA
jgi:hypothetical protein